MPKKTFFCDDNYLKIAAAIQEICADMNRDGFTHAIRINSLILQECFVSAEGSVKFYNLDDKEVSHYKEIAHIAYWINKLKPIRVMNPFNLLHSLKGIGFDIAQSMAGIKVQKEEIRSGLEYPINEHVAYYLASDHIRACQIEEAKAKGATAKVAYDKKIAETQHKIDIMKETMMLSMRYHNHSARGYALMVEAQTRIDEL